MSNHANQYCLPETRLSSLLDLLNDPGGNAIPEAHCKLLKLIEIIAPYGPIIERWCRRCGLNQVQAEEVLLQITDPQSLLTRFRKFDRARGRFRAYIKMVTRRVAIDLYRRSAQHLTGGTENERQIAYLPAPAERVESGVDSQPSWEVEARVLLARAEELVRSRIAERTWHAYQLLVKEKIPATEVAARLGISCTNAHQIRCRIMGRIGEELLKLKAESGRSLEG